MKLVALGLFGISVFASNAQIRWYPSLDLAKTTALVEQKLILVDFTASWCGPCKQMDMYVWSHPEVDSLASRFVVAKIDLDKERQSAVDFDVKTIPRILVIDPWGEVLYDRVGYASKDDLTKIMTSYPSNVQPIYADRDIDEMKVKDFIGNYEIGIAFQKYLPALQNPAKDAFSEQSLKHLRDAEKLAKKANEQIQEEKAILAQCTTYSLTGADIKSINEIDRYGLVNFDPVNQPHVYYVLAVSYHNLGDQNALESTKRQLENSPGGKHFLRMLDQLVRN